MTTISADKTMNDRFVLFLDILGFSQLVLNNSPENLKQIYDSELHQTAASVTMMSAGIFGRTENFQIFSSAQGVLRDVKQDQLSFHVMSDTLIAWTNDDMPESLLHLSQFTATYLAMTLTLGIPHRGAISKGNIQLIDLPLNGKLQSNVIGSGVVNAHRFEAGQEWTGCVVDPRCIEELPIKKQDFIQLPGCPIVEYPPLYSSKAKLRSELAIDWPRCLKLLIPNTDPNFIRTQFGRYEKPIDECTDKIQNSEAFFTAMTQPKS